MKKSLALALALIMVMGCMSFAAAVGRTVTDLTGSPDIRSTYEIESTEANRASVQLTYFAGDSAWQTGSNNQYISVQAKLAAPKAEARFVQLLRSDGEKIGGLVYLGDGISYFEYSYQFDKGSHTVQNLKLEWYDKDDSKNPLYTDDFTCTLVLTSAKPADASRIKTVSGAKVSDGSVAFDAAPAGETTITVSRPNDYASSYTISTDGAEDTEGNSTAETPAGITVSGLSTETPQKYTIKWYSGEDGNKFLVGTDTLTVSVRPEGYYSFAAYKTPVVIEKSDGTQANITPEDGFLPATSVELNYELTKKQWEEVFYKYGEDNRIFLPLWFYLPGNAEDYFKSEYFDNESRPEKEDLNSLKDVPYFDVGLYGGEGGYSGYKYFHEGLVIAQVKYEGNNVIIEPQSGKVSWLIKWLDYKNVDHFHRVTFDVTVSFSGHGIKLTNASPAINRVILDGREGTNGSYSDGTVRYMLAKTESGFQYGANGRGNTITRLVRPSDNAKKATVNGENVNISETDNAIQLTVEARNDQSMTEAFTVCWLDADNKIIKTERITISNCPTGAGVPWPKYWAPIGNGSINVQDQRLGSFFSYDNNGKLLFKVDETNAGALNVDKLSQNDLVYEITPPAGAKYFKMSGQHSPLYDTYFADSTKQWLKDQPFEKCVLEDGALKPYYYSFGKLFNRTQVEGVYVYTVNNTQVTFADIVIFQWYKDDGTLIKAGDKEGYYFYLIKEPYVKISKTEALNEDPTEAVKEATIVVSDPTDKEILNKILKTEKPLQEAIDPNSNTKYLYMKLTYIDESTGLEVELGTEGADVYLAYPEDMAYEQAQGYTFKLTHYADEKHATHESVTLEATPYGLKFNTKSFSPFLLEWTPVGSSPSHNESGGLPGVNITNLTNREISSYRLGGGMFIFRLGGSGDVSVTAGGMVVTPDADGWYTVSANARIVVDYPVVALPKTGDMPVWRWLLDL